MVSLWRARAESHIRPQAQTRQLQAVRSEGSEAATSSHGTTGFLTADQVAPSSLRRAALTHILPSCAQRTRVQHRVPAALPAGADARLRRPSLLRQPPRCEAVCFALLPRAGREAISARALHLRTLPASAAMPTCLPLRTASLAYRFLRHNCRQILSSLQRRRRRDSTTQRLEVLAHNVTDQLLVRPPFVSSLQLSSTVTAQLSVFLRSL